MDDDLNKVAAALDGTIPAALRAVADRTQRQIREVVDHAGLIEGLRADHIATLLARLSAVYQRIADGTP